MLKTILYAAIGFDTLLAFSFIFLNEGEKAITSFVLAIFLFEVMDHLP